jgi:hypothetical protein
MVEAAKANVSLTGGGQRTLQETAGGGQRTVVDAATGGAWDVEGDETIATISLP